MRSVRRTAFRFTPLLLSVAVAATGQENQNSLALEEIIVTARKKEESLQDTPISITAFSQDDLAQQGITAIDDLQGKVPSLNLTPFPTQNTSLRLFIRGVGAGDIQVTQDPAVGVYIDQVYIGRATGLGAAIPGEEPGGPPAGAAPARRERRSNPARAERHGSCS